MPRTILDYNVLHDLELDRYASLRRMCAAIADDIAYNTHDIDDGLRAGLLTLGMLRDVSLPCRLLDEVRELYPALDPVRTGHELMRRQITQMVEDVIATAGRNLAETKPGSADAVRGAGRAIVTFSAEMAAAEKELKAFLFKNLYRHAEVVRVRVEADRIVRKLFDAYYADPRAMPDGWREGLDRAQPRVKARHVADFLAGMTDTYAIKEYERLFDQGARFAIGQAPFPAGNSPPRAAFSRTKVMNVFADFNDRIKKVVESLELKS